MCARPTICSEGNDAFQRRLDESLNLTQHRRAQRSAREHGTCDPIGRVARLHREPEKYIAGFGHTAYDIKRQDCLWHVYRLLGLLHGSWASHVRICE